MPFGKYDLPIVPHSLIADVNCCGCLIPEIRGEDADLICNECSALIETVPAAEIKPALLKLAMSIWILRSHVSALRSGSSVSGIHIGGRFCLQSVRRWQCGARSGAMTITFEPSRLRWDQAFHGESLPARTPRAPGVRERVRGLAYVPFSIR